MVNFKEINKEKWNTINTYTSKQTIIPGIEKIAQPDVTGKVVSLYGGADVFSFIQAFPNANEYTIIDSALFATKESNKPEFSTLKL